MKPLTETNEFARPISAEIASKGRRKFKLIQAVFTNSQAQIMGLVQSHSFSETNTDVSNKFWPFSGGTSGLYSSQKSRVWLKNEKRTLHPRRFTELSSEACTLFHLVTDVRYPYVSIVVKLHAHPTISKYRYELAVWFNC